MKRYFDDNLISAIDLGDDFYNRPNELVAYLDSLPAGAEISDIVIAPGSHGEGKEVICEKREGYKTTYYNRFGIPPSDTKYNSTWWTIEGSEVDVYTLAKIITKGTKYYCTADVFEDDEF